MLVHESVRQADHSDLAGLVDAAWSRAGYSEPSGLRRLHDLWRNDFLPVSEVRAGTEPFPRDWNELRPHIGAAIDRIFPRSLAGRRRQRRQGLRLRPGGPRLPGARRLEDSRRGGEAEQGLHGRRPHHVLLHSTHPGGRHPHADGAVVRLPARVQGPRPVVPGPQCLGTARDQVDLYEAFTAIVRDEEDFRADFGSSRGWTRTDVRGSGRSTSHRWSSRASRGSSRQERTRCTTPTSRSRGRAGRSRTSSSSQEGRHMSTCGTSPRSNPCSTPQATRARSSPTSTTRTAPASASSRLPR